MIDVQNEAHLHFTSDVFQWARFRNVKDIQFPDPGPRPFVDILIGVDYAELHYSFKDVGGRSGKPVARLTPLGWTCVGSPNGLKGSDLQTSFTHTYLVREHKQDSDEISVLLRSFWEVPASGTLKEAQILNYDDKFAPEKVEKSIKYVDGRYQVAIPLKDDKPELPDNYNMAVRRLFNTEKRLRNNPEVEEAYSKCISQYLEKGHIRKIDPAESGPSRKWYLPHFPVVRPNRTTTKTRIVFDPSAKCEGVSLNDTILPGPKLQKDLNDVLLRFRKHPVALVCDIAEMYLRIEVAPKDRPYLRFLWRSLEKEKEPEEFKFNRVVFGLNSSPFQAQFVAQPNAEKYKDELPMTAETVLKYTSMDDSMDSVADDNQALELYSQLNMLRSRAGMRARKWLSNSSKLLEKIPVKDRASELHLDSSGVPMVKTLGGA